MIEIEELCKSYSKEIFLDFNLTIEQGESVLISGKSGRGKSTLLNIIGMLDDDYEGNVNILGYDNPMIDSKEGRGLLKTDISYVFQNYGLMDNKTIYQNLNIVHSVRKLKKKNKAEVMNDVLEQVNLNLSIDTPIYELSGGEQQRVAIAKVILKQPKLILCDEPTGSLDSDNAKTILGILKKLNEDGSTIIIASHDPIVNDYVDRIIGL